MEEKNLSIDLLTSYLKRTLHQTNLPPNQSNFTDFNKHTYIFPRHGFYNSTRSQSIYFVNVTRFYHRTKNSYEPSLLKPVQYCGESSDRSSILELSFFHPAVPVLSFVASRRSTYTRNKTTYISI